MNSGKKVRVFHFRGGVFCVRPDLDSGKNFNCGGGWVGVGGGVLCQIPEQGCSEEIWSKFSGSLAGWCITVFHILRMWRHINFFYIASQNTKPSHRPTTNMLFQYMCKIQWKGIYYCPKYFRPFTIAWPVHAIVGNIRIFVFLENSSKCTKLRKNKATKKFDLVTRCASENHYLFCTPTTFTKNFELHF